MRFGARQHGRVDCTASTLQWQIDMAALIPPMPPSARADISGIGILRAVRRNAYEAFPLSFLEKAVVRREMPVRPLVVATSGDAIRHVMIDHYEAFARVPALKRVLGPLIGKGLATSEGEAWRQQRHAMAPAFAPKHVNTLMVHIAPATENALRKLDAQRDMPLQVLEFMQLLSLDIAASAMFSVDMGAIGSGLRSLLNEYTADLGKVTLGDFLLPGWMPTLMSRRRAAFGRRWKAYMEPIVEGRRRAGSEGRAPDLFDMLIRAHGEADSQLIVDEVTTMLIGGHETTALTLFWACALLAQAPGLQQELAREAAAAEWPDEANPARVPALPLARAVVQETLRLYSPAYMSARLAGQAQTIAGTPVAKGSLVLVPFLLIHRNPDYWPRPDVFDPARFIDAKPADRFAYLPFGIGPHVCIGAQLAMLEATFVIARLFRDYELTLASPRPILPVANLATRPDHSPAFHVRRRRG
jgi:cytochrome P450